VARRKVDQLVERLRKNADDIHLKRIPWDEFSRRNGEIHAAIEAEGEEVCRAVMARLLHPEQEED
jgi:hypothetical protein